MVRNGISNPGSTLCGAQLKKLVSCLLWGKNVFLFKNSLSKVFMLHLNFKTFNNTAINSINKYEFQNKDKTR